MTAPILQIEDLYITFYRGDQTLRAVRGVNLNLYPSEAVALVGESGCGKTLTAKAILQLISSPSARIESGRILYQGKDLLRLNEKGMQKIRGKEIGMIFQDPLTALNPTMRVGSQVIEGLLHHYPETSKEEAYQKGIELLRLVGISQPELRFQQYPHELSGGMRQRILIAIALAPSPKIIIADEPTTALDVTIQAQILELLKEIQEKTGTAILFITHALSIVSSFCKRVNVMYAGKIIESASVESLFISPRHPYTRRLIDSIPRLDKKKPLQPILGSPPNPANLPTGCAFCPRCPERLNICSKQHPPDFPHENKHESACWFYAPEARNL